MKIVIAPDKYKGFFSAEEASDIMCDIVHRRLPDAEIKICPMADGGEGTAKILAKNMGAIPFTSTTKNAYNEVVSFTYYATDTCAILESAEIIGLQKVKSPLTPLDVSTYSLGKIFAHLTKEYQQTILCIGGTSTVDCGVGFLQAMGTVCKYQGHIIDEIFTPRNYLHFDEFILPDTPNYTTNSHIALCDVQNDILRPDGQDMTLFAPQKGLKPSEMPFLRQMIKHITTIAKWNRKNSLAQTIGAAGGGLSFAFAQLFGNIKLGAQFLIEKYGIKEYHPDLILTGEGCYDTQSILGKVPHAIMTTATDINSKFAIIAGKTDNIPTQIKNKKTIIDTTQFHPELPLNKTTATIRLRLATDFAITQFLNNNL